MGQRIRLAQKLILFPKYSSPCLLSPSVTFGVPTSSHWSSETGLAALIVKHGAQRPAMSMSTPSGWLLVQLQTLNPDCAPRIRFSEPGFPWLSAGCLLAHGRSPRKITCSISTRFNPACGTFQGLQRRALLRLVAHELHKFAQPLAQMVRTFSLYDVGAT